METWSGEETSSPSDSKIYDHLTNALSKSHTSNLIKFQSPPIVVRMTIFRVFFSEDFPNSLETINPCMQRLCPGQVIVELRFSRSLHAARDDSCMINCSLKSD